ncbi:MAG: phosphoribosylaminoimidazolesuccinocarboxamide synthase [Caldithrix sp.]|nr:phosphoribosylaminoimidazolesuccinocarboxamide synthase [Caldithrix sp.]
MNCLTTIITPQIEKIHSGKVRESFRIDENTRMIVATDRISSFDKVLDTPIPGKGAVLNKLAAYWFKETKDIIENHFVEVIDPNISLVREATPIRVEMIVRGYMTGSAWRSYQQGKRTVSGVQIPDGMKKNQAFDEPIVTPTTKEESDREISAKELVEEGWVSAEIYKAMEKTSLKLFKHGQAVLKERGIILVDTKYEFGLIDNKLVLIDEIHTPDSSRFWSAENYETEPDNAEQLDKEYVRSYLLKHKKDGAYPNTLPNDVVQETTRRYRDIYGMITGEVLPEIDNNTRSRVHANLVRHKLIKDGFVAIIMGSPSDLDHCNKMKDIMEQYDIMVDLRVVSAHKNGENLGQVIKEYNNSIEPAAIIAVAGRSNGLGGALAANVTVPVINCPPFKDKTDQMVNINSSLMMPSNTPAVTVVDPKNAAMAALRTLNLPRLKTRFEEEINEMKSELKAADKRVRGR